MAQTEFVESRRTTETCTSITQERTYTVTSQDPWDALSDSDVPQMGDRHPSRTDMFVIERMAETISPELARVTVVYSREHYQSGGINQEEVEIDVGADQKRVYWTLPTKTSTGVPISAEKISDALTGELGVNIYSPIVVLSFTQYKSFFNYLGYAQLVGKINIKEWRGMAARTVRYDGAMGHQVGNEKYSITHRFAYDPAGINPHPPRLKTDITEVAGKDADGNDITTQAYEWIPVTDNGNIIYDEKRVYQEIDFAQYFGGI